ncbi:MAG: hypothetical protein AB7S38_29090 [Vulcanimicrobiota bacterium]
MQVDKLLQYADLEEANFQDESLLFRGQLHAGGVTLDGTITLPCHDEEIGGLVADTAQWFADASQDGNITTAELVNLAVKVTPSVLAEMVERGVVPEKYLDIVKVILGVLQAGKQ